MSWKYTDATERVVFRVTDTGTESCLASEVQAWIAAGNEPEQADAPDLNAAIQAQIDAIEQATLTNRGAREGWITLIRREAAAQGVTDDAVIASINPFFKKLKEIDAQVKALRDQLHA
jgi:hypothetical protein